MNLVSRRNLLVGTSAAVMAPIVAEASPIAAGLSELKKCHVKAVNVNVKLDGLAGWVLSGQPPKETTCWCTDFEEGGTQKTQLTLPFGKPVFGHRPKLRIKQCTEVHVEVSTTTIDLGGQVTALKIRVPGTKEGGAKQASLSQVKAECCLECGGIIYCSEAPFCIVCDDMVYCCG